MRKKTIILVTLLLAALGTTGYMWHRHQVSSQINSMTPRQAAQAAHVKTVNIVALGDSLTEGVGDNKKQGGYTGRIARKLEQSYGIKVNIKNYGKSGDRSDQMLERLVTQKKIQAAVKSANVIIMTVGGNDLQQLLLKNLSASTPTALTKVVNQNQNDYQKKLTKLYKYVRSFNKKSPIIIFGNYNPLYVHFPTRTDFNQDVMIFNKVNKSVANAQYHSYYVSSYDLTYGQYKTAKARATLLQDAEKAAKKDKSYQSVTKALLSSSADDVKNNWISTSDNYHPNSIGYDYMTTQLYNEMKKVQKQWLLPN